MLARFFQRIVSLSAAPIISVCVFTGCVFNTALAQTPPAPVDRITVSAPPWNCRDEFVDWMGAGGGYFITICDNWGFLDLPPDALINQSNLGAGSGVSAAEQQRRAACQAASADWNDKNCASRRVGNRPSSNFDFSFNFPFRDGYNYDYLRGVALAFQQALWDDPTGNAWNNSSDFILRMNQTCESGAGGVTLVSIPACKLMVTTYFGQGLLNDGGYQGWLNSQAASDLSPSRYGQACTSLAAVRAQNQCS